MDRDFWLTRWRDHKIGFHLSQVNPALIEYFPQTGAVAGDKVLVPLCGKSLDMTWLQRQGYQVLGVELSPIAVTEFFSEQGLQPGITRSGSFESSRSGDIEILRGDFLELSTKETGQIAAVYDRAALIALPREMRAVYFEKLAELMPAGCKSLLISLECPEGEMQGPPFSVTESELKTLCANQFTISLLGERDVLDADPKFRDNGVTALSEKYYLLQRR